jgi:uroporphyrinogen-III synthase
MAGPLSGLSILVPESRELDLFAGMLEAEGATTVRCPMVQILDLENTTEAEAWIAQLIAGHFDDLVLLTGEGLRRLLAISDRSGNREAFVSALAGVRKITRGPKPARVLREIGLLPDIPATIPTSEGILAALTEDNLKGRRMAVQLYPGTGGMALVEALRKRGAIVSAITPYRYATQAESEKVVDAIHAMAEGRIGMIAFTSMTQLDRLLDVAKEFQIEPVLKTALSTARIASIGPVVTERLAALGITRVIQPHTSFHLKPLVRAILADRKP